MDSDPQRFYTKLASLCSTNIRMGARFIYACAMTKSNAIKATLFANKHNSFLFQFEFFRLAVLKIKLKKKQREFLSMWEKDFTSWTEINLVKAIDKE